MQNKVDTIPSNEPCQHEIRIGVVEHEDLLNLMLEHTMGIVRTLSVPTKVSFVFDPTHRNGHVSC